MTDAQVRAAVVLAVGGGIGLYVLGSTAVAHRRAIKGGELPTHVPEDYESSVADDLVAFVASMTVLGIVISQTPPLLAQAAALVR